MKPLLNVCALHQIQSPGAGTLRPIFRIPSFEQAIDEGAVLHEMVHPMYSQFSVSRDGRTEFQVPQHGDGHHQCHNTGYYERPQPRWFHEAVAEDAHRRKGE